MKSSVKKKNTLLQTFRSQHFSAFSFILLHYLHTKKWKSVLFIWLGWRVHCFLASLETIAAMLTRTFPAPIPRGRSAEKSAKTNAEKSAKGSQQRLAVVQCWDGDSEQASLRKMSCCYVWLLLLTAAAVTSTSPTTTGLQNAEPNTSLKVRLA